ncbi:MAG: regulatory protein RecX [Gammaproteobacteria bacterium]|nr:regulatory protein RecX [Gammaproteobacteria bacterium]
MASPQQECRAAALRWLTRREYSRHELQQKLQTKGFESAVIESVIAELLRERYLSDERFAEALVQSRVNRGVGPVRLRQELRQHELNDDVATPMPSEAEWRRRASEVRRKRFGAQMPQTYEERAKQMRFLQYRGFTTEQINAVMATEDIAETE